jgi:hypothetical protein
METSWNPNLVSILEKIRLNSVSMSERHRARSDELNQMTKYFEIPTIICSIFSSSFQSLGAIPQTKSQLIQVSISMFIAVLTSIKLWLGLAAQITKAVSLSTDFYILSIEIFKILNLQEKDRNVDALQFTNEVYGKYKSLIESSALLKLRRDELIKIDIDCSDTSSLSTKSSFRSIENIIVNERNEF